MYVSKDYQRMGIAKTLYRELETFARKQKIDRIISEVSITAKTFFEKLEFEVVDQQDVKIEGITLTNFKMEKQLF